MVGDIHTCVITLCYPDEVALLYIGTYTTTFIIGGSWLHVDCHETYRFTVQAI